MKLLVATRNAGKLAEARAILADAGIETVSPEEAGIAWSPAEDLLESAETFEGNAGARPSTSGNNLACPQWPMIPAWR